LVALDLFVSGENGYHTYRIPALVKTRSAIHAFCEGRKHGRGDSGKIDLLMRSSRDGGRSWSDARVVVTEPGMTCGNPCPVYDGVTDTIWLPFCKNIGAIAETEICRGNGPRTVWLMASEDDCQSWSTARDITSQVKDAGWTWYATGPCHGIQLSSGRLVVPCDHMVGVYLDRHADPYHSHVILSDDHGETWRVGGIVDEGTNECAVAEFGNGDVYINCRNYRQMKCRASAWSDDGGETFGRFTLDETLADPICQGSLLDLGDNRFVLSNAASETRENVSLRLSDNGGERWSEPYVLWEGPSAYSDTVSADSGVIGCFYECGSEGPYERLRFETVLVQDLEAVT
jgi:sialidase-1